WVVAKTATDARKPVRTRAIPAVVAWRAANQGQESRARWLDYTHPSSALLFENLVSKGLYSGPMHLWPEMMFGVVTVKEPGPVVKLAVGAHAPRNRLVRIAPVMPIVAVQIRQAVAKVIEWQKKTDIMPVKNTEDHKSRNERREFEDSPKRVARILAF